MIKFAMHESDSDIKRCDVGKMCFEVKHPSYPQENKINNETGWLFGTLARILEDNGLVDSEKQTTALSTVQSKHKYRIVGESKMSICAYCGYEKNNEEFSQEHVIPRAMGGNLHPINPFSLNTVCKRCNSLSGSFIDGQYIRSWFTQNGKNRYFMKYIDITQNPILPLNYMGLLPDISLGDKICEFWLGPTGDTIYHFHEPYPESIDVAPMVGVPTFAKKNEIDPGFAFLFVRSNNPVWYASIFHSFIEQFTQAELYLGNGPTPQGYFSDIPETYGELHTKLKRLNGETHKVSVPLGVNYGDRFLVKLAIGLGTIFLNDSFVDSNSARNLRSFLWAKEQKMREKIDIRGQSFLSGRDDLKTILSWDQGHVIGFINDNSRLSLHVNFFSSQDATIEISSEPEHWKGKFDNLGTIYLVCPGLQKYAGPIALENFIAHKQGYYNKEIRDLEVALEEYALPPFDI